MGYVFAICAIAAYLFLCALVLRLIFDWVQMFARYWRPKGAVLVLASGVNYLTDPPLRMLRNKIPPLQVGGLALDLGFLILMVVVGFIYSALVTMTNTFS